MPVGRKPGFKHSLETKEKGRVSTRKSKITGRKALARMVRYSNEN